MRNIFVGFLTALVLAACGGGDAPTAMPSTGNAADVVFTNADIYTVDSQQEWAEAVAVSGNKIVYVGDAAGVEPMIGDGTEVIDATGKVIMPGVVVAHSAAGLGRADEGRPVTPQLDAFDSLDPSSRRVVYAVLSGNRSSVCSTMA